MIVLSSDNLRQFSPRHVQPCSQALSSLQYTGLLANVFLRAQGKRPKAWNCEAYNKKIASYVHSQIIITSVTIVLITIVKQWKARFYSIRQNANMKIVSSTVLIKLNKTLLITISHLLILMISQKNLWEENQHRFKKKKLWHKLLWYSSSY